MTESLNISDIFQCYAETNTGNTVVSLTACQFHIAKLSSTICDGIKLFWGSNHNLNPTTLTILPMQCLQNTVIWQLLRVLQSYEI